MQDRGDLQQTSSSAGKTHEADRDSGYKSCAARRSRRCSRRSVRMPDISQSRFGIRNLNRFATRMASSIRKG